MNKIKQRSGRRFPNLCFFLIKRRISVDHIAHDAMEDIQIFLAQRRGAVVLVGDDADANDFVHLKGDGDDVLTAQIGWSDARGDGIAVGAHHQVDDRALVGDFDASVMVERGEDFF